MDTTSLISLDRVRCDVQGRSKKHALDVLSEVLAASVDVLTPSEIFDSLIQRERLGCTALGGSVAMPHGRIAGIDVSLGAFLRLTEPVDFDAADGEPVDLIFGVLIPEDCGESELRKLKELTASISESSLQQRLRDAQDEEQVYAVLTGKALKNSPRPAVQVR